MGSGGDTTERRAIGPEDSPLVAFARECDFESKNSSMRMSLAWYDILPWLGYLLAFMVVQLRPIGLWSFATIAVVWALWIGLPRQLYRDSRRTWSPCPRAPDDHERVACVGTAWRLKRFSVQGAIVDEFYEPYVALVPFAMRASQLAALAGILVGCTVASALKVLTDVHPGVMYGLFYVGAITGWFTAATVVPTYVRVVPGRLEVLERGMLGRRLIARTVFDLRALKVIVDLNRSTVFLVDAHGKVRELTLRAAANKDALAAAILRAAVSTHTPPPLPEDELVG